MHHAEIETIGAVMHDAKVGDIYVDGNGKLWRIMGRWDEPVIVAEEIEPATMDRRKSKTTAGITGLLWSGFERIYRPAPKPPYNNPLIKPDSELKL